MRSFSKDSFLVHFFHERTDFVVGELADVVAEEDLVVGERGQRCGARGLQGGLGKLDTFGRKSAKLVDFSTPTNTAVPRVLPGIASTVGQRNKLICCGRATTGWLRNPNIIDYCFRSWSACDNVWASFVGPQTQPTCALKFHFKCWPRSSRGEQCESFFFPIRVLAMPCASGPK